MRAVVAGLLAAYAALAYHASLVKGLSFDEGEQLAVGYNLWRNGDYRIEGANGDFIKRWATLPFLFTRPAFVGRDDPSWRKGEPYGLGYRFFFALGNHPDSLLRPARAMVVPLGLATGLLVFYCARTCFGVAGGLISLGLFAFSPNMLAFGSIVSTDMSITLLLPAATICIWRLLHEVTAARLAASLGVFGLALLAKPSAFALLPITAVLVTVKLMAGGPLGVGWRGRRWMFVRRGHQAAMFAAMFALHAAAGWSAIWAHYGFRYTASPVPEDPGVVLQPTTARDPVPRVFAATLAWSRRTHFLPEGFLRGIDALLATDDQLGSFMAGEWKLGGRREFFFYAMWVKTRPAVILLFALGGARWLWLRRERASPPAGAATPAAYEPTPHLVLIVVFLMIASWENINLGHRHVLPVYPSLYVLAGAAALALRSVWGRGAVALLCAWAAAEPLAIRPDYLAYFGPQAGGPAKGFRHLVDSSLDWGMDLPALKRWLDHHNPAGREPVFLAYFGADDPDHYGIRAEHLPSYSVWRPRSALTPLRPGFYAISASLLEGVYTAAFGPWSAEAETVYHTSRRNLELIARTKPQSPERQSVLAQLPPKLWRDEFYVFENLRFARLCAWLRHQGDPPYHVGHSILIWKLDHAALQAALLGPPAELADAPLFLRRF